MTLLQTAPSLDFSTFGAYGVSLALLLTAVITLWIRGNKKETDHKEEIKLIVAKYDLQLKEQQDKYEEKLTERDDDIKELNKEIRDFGIGAVNTINKFVEYQTRKQP